MDFNRAQQIINTNIEVEVFYNNDSVWIKNLDENSGMANIQSLKTSNEMQVPISALQEENRTK